MRQAHALVDTATGPLFSAVMGDANPLPTDRADKAGTSVGDRPPFDELDMNDDGRLSKAELAHDNEFLSRFARWDSDPDQDGYLTMAEYDASAIVDAE